MQIILWIIFGAFAGWIASIIYGNDDNQNALGNIVVGILGAFVGGFIVEIIGGAGLSGFSLYSLVVSIGGALLVLYMKHMLIDGV